LTTLNKAFPDGRHTRLLETLLPTGVADSQQLQQVLDCSRDQLNRLLARLRNLDGQILIPTSSRIPRPGKRGVPTVYQLGVTGAALLRRLGHPRAHACRLTNGTQIAHARAVLEVRLAALAAGLTVTTETELPYGEGQVLRPDNLITLPDGAGALFEVEQTASYRLLRRIREGLCHKVAFFRSDAGQAVSPTVRVLLNLPHGRNWDQTMNIWEQATAIVAREHGGALPFEIVALPLYEFVEQPDWGAAPDAQRWEALLDPAQLPDFAPPPSQPDALLARVAPAAPPRRQRRQLPQGLKRRTPRDDRLVMEAYYQHILTAGPTLAYSAEHPRPDPEFFVMLSVVYAASHPPDATPWQRAAYPYASLYLLRKYLDLHPRLRQALSKALVRGGGSMRWNTANLLHRMQVVCDLFLHYHGFCSGRSLQVQPVMAWKHQQPTAAFQISVNIRPQLLLGEGDGVVPASEEVVAAEEALSWVLWTLFAYSEVLGLRQPAFW